MAFLGYPDGGILKNKNFSSWQNNYLTTLSQRDLPLWGLPSKPTQTLRLFQMLASVNGQLWNASQIGSSLGITYHTINTYTDFLTEVFLIRKLQPYFINIKKRITKSSKIYWREEPKNQNPRTGNLEKWCPETELFGARAPHPPGSLCKVSLLARAKISS